MFKNRWLTLCAVSLVELFVGSSLLLALPIHDAADEGDLKKLQQLIAEGADVNARDSEGRTPLIIAAAKGEGGTTDVIKYFLVFHLLLNTPGIEVNAWDNGGFTALHAAAGSGNPLMVGELLDHPQIDTAAGTDFTPLHIAVMFNRLLVVRRLLERKIYNIQHPSTSAGGNTPLHLAAESGSGEIVQALLDAGAGINLLAINNAGQIPFAVAKDDALEKLKQYIVKMATLLCQALTLSNLVSK